MRTTSDLLAEVNRSGFPLQIAIAQLFSANAGADCWKVRYMEHRWENPQAEASGYADVVLCNDAQVMNVVLECKRVQDTSWMFLRNKRDGASVRAKPYALFQRADGRKYSGWLDVELVGSVPESSFAAAVGDSRRELLERLAGPLMNAIEAISKEEQDTELLPDHECRFWFPMIVTTASLKICEYDPAAIDLATGKFENADFVDAGAVAFRKQVGAQSSLIEKSQYGLSSDDLARSKESVVFVVNVLHLKKFVRELDFANSRTVASRLAHLAKFGI